jgi:hypothetical protein
LSAKHTDIMTNGLTELATDGPVLGRERRLRR